MCPDWLCLARAHASQASTHLNVPPHLRLAEKNNKENADDEVKGELHIHALKGHKRTKKHHPERLGIIVIAQKEAVRAGHDHNIQDHA